MTPLRILSGALDELSEGQIVLRGVIDPETFSALERPAYQRETLAKPTIAGLMEAYRDGAGRVPDVELAVRGERYGCTDVKGTYSITGSVFIIDGLQRISAACQFVSEGGRPLVGAMVHFGTTEQWERERFRILNMRRTRLSPNVLLRNNAAECPSLRRLRQLCSDDSFALCQRVSWSQHMRREELLTALTFLKTVTRLHSRFGAGRYVDVAGICQAIPPMMANVGHATMIENVKAFFEVLDAAWGGPRDPLQGSGDPPERRLSRRSRGRDLRVSGVLVGEEPPDRSGHAEEDRPVPAGRTERPYDGVQHGQHWPAQQAHRGSHQLRQANAAPARPRSLSRRRPP